MIVNIPVSIGELVDKLTILELKLRFIVEPTKLENVQKEHRLLDECLKIACKNLNTKVAVELLLRTADLQKINEKLWVIEDKLRENERLGTFGSRFIELARGVYTNNDLRSQIKKEINLLVGSAIQEEKSYAEY